MRIGLKSHTITNPLHVNQTTAIFTHKSFATLRYFFASIRFIASIHAMLHLFPKKNASNVRNDMKFPEKTYAITDHFEWQTGSIGYACELLFAAFDNFMMRHIIMIITILFIILGWAIIDAITHFTMGNASRIILAQMPFGC